MGARIATALISTVLGCAAATAGAGEPAADIAPLLEAVRTKHHQPALAAAVVRGDQIIASAAVGLRRLDGTETVELTDRFHIGSCTKAITSTLIGMLVDEGKLRWSTKIVDVFPDLKEGASEKFAEVTLEQLLTHRAGVPPFTDGSAAEFAMVRSLTGSQREQRRALVAAVIRTEPVAAPGSKMIYSNAGYAIAAAMAEQAADTPWETLVQQRIFNSLGMTSAGFGWPAAANHPHEPWGHWPRTPTEGAAAPPPPAPQDPAGTYRLYASLAPAGDIHCSAGDLARFAMSHLQGLQGKDRRLTPATWKRLHKPELSSYAMGWVRRPGPDGSPVEWHNGSASTFFTWMTVSPKNDLAVVVMTNSGDGEPACLEATEALLKRFAPAPGR